jgi:hypothetical protein
MFSCDHNGAISMDATFGTNDMKFHFAFKGLNHLSKSSTIFWLVIIHAKGTPM